MLFANWVHGYTFNQEFKTYYYYILLFWVMKLTVITHFNTILHKINTPLTKVPVFLHRQLYIYDWKTKVVIFIDRYEITSNVAFGWIISHHDDLSQSLSTKPLTYIQRRLIIIGRKSPGCYVTLSSLEHEISLYNAIESHLSIFCHCMCHATTGVDFLHHPGYWLAFCVKYTWRELTRNQVLKLK